MAKITATIYSNDPSSVYAVIPESDSQLDTEIKLDEYAAHHRGQHYAQSFNAKNTETIQFKFPNIDKAQEFKQLVNRLEF